MSTYNQTPYGGAVVLGVDTPSRDTVPEDFWVEWHPTANVFSEPADSEWVRVTNGIREMDCWHGFDRTTARIEAGEMVVVFDNRDRSLDPNNLTGPHYPNWGPMRQVRLRARASGLSRTLWRGIITQTKPEWSINDGWCVLTARETLAAAAKTISDTLLDTAIAAAKPDLWLPFRDGGYTTPEQRGVALPFTAADTQKSDTTQFFADQPSTAFPYKGRSYSQMLYPYPAGVNTAGFTLMALFKSSTDDVGQVVWSIGPFPASAACPSGDVAFVVDANGTYSLRVGNASGSSLLQFSQPHRDVGTLIFGQWRPADTMMEASIGVEFIGGGTYANSGLGGTWYPRPGYIRAGAGLDATNSANPFLGGLNHVCLWQRYLTQAERSGIYRGYFGEGGADAAFMINWVLDRLGISASRRDVQSGGIVMGGLHHDANAVELMSRAAATEGGYFFHTKDGKFRFKLRGYRGIHRGTYDTNPPPGSGRGTLVDVTPDVDDRTFYTVAKTLNSTVPGKPTEVVFRHPNADKYGEIEFNDPTMFDTEKDAKAAAVRIVGNATPRTDIVEAVMQAGTDGIEMIDLLDSEVLDTADVVARIPGNKVPEPTMRWGEPGFWGERPWAEQPPFEQKSVITKVGHNYSRDHVWRTRWAMSPDK